MIFIIFVCIYIFFFVNGKCSYFVLFKVTQLCFILDTILPLVSPDIDAVKASNLKRMSVTSNDMAIPLNSMISFVAGVGVLEAVFIQALYLSLGALLTDATSRHLFDETVKDLSGFIEAQKPYNKSKKPNLKYIPCDEPTWYDYFLDFNNLEWVAWKKAVPEYVHNNNIKYDDILVPTVETTRLIWILKLINEVRIQFLGIIYFVYKKLNS